MGNTPPTIPTKYITILNPNAHEKRGFSQQAPRFAAQPVCISHLIIKSCCVLAFHYRKVKHRMLVNTITVIVL